MPDDYRSDENVHPTAKDLIACPPNSHFFFHLENPSLSFEKVLLVYLLWIVALSRVKQRRRVI